jgi:hypothetical protein
MDEKISRSGKALSAISSGLIIYVLGSGEFTGNANIAIGSFEFHNPLVIEISILVLFAYLMLRYWQRLNNPFSKFKEQSLKKINEIDSFKKHLKSIAEKQFKSDLKDGRIKNVTYNPRKKYVVGIGRGTMPFYVKDDKIGGEYIMEEPKVNYHFKVYLNWFWTWIYLIRTIFKNEEFWVILLPWYLSFIAIALIYIRIFTSISCG